ncbi:hypothetical protein CAP36_06825 [Chitinophagaceae bacterium IBVUCB2]|nr:hypothetical protein CAP36_06825 [Chitinophagaceae bacterium IBVUCB2]
MKYSLIILLCIISSTASVGQKEVVQKAIQSGNDLYKQQQFDQAATEYENALKADPANTTAKFNRANTLTKQNKSDEAVKAFTQIAGDAKEAALKAKSYYNKGAVLSQQKKLEESAEAYKNALRQDPNDKEARENLQKALLELKKKNPPPKKQDDKQKKKNEQQQKKQQQSKLSPKEAEQRLKLLEQKEKEAQQRLQKQKSKSGGSQTKDW